MSEYLNSNKKVIYNVDDGLSYDYRKKREIVISEAPSLQVSYHIRIQCKISNTIYTVQVTFRMLTITGNRVKSCLANIIAKHNFSVIGDHVTIRILYVYSDL